MYTKFGRPDLQKLALDNFCKTERRIHLRTDRLFAILLFSQWIVGIAYSLIVTPLTWAGTESHVHPHVLSAVFLGGVIISLPLILIYKMPATAMTRQLVAVSQMLMGALFIHLTGGRIETHFHIFGSLAFLAMYRDWRVLATASVVVTVDHVIGSYYFPLFVFGQAQVSPWLWVEHTGWVLFEDLFLGYSCIAAQRDMRDISIKQAALSSSNSSITRQIIKRTEELVVTHDELELQRARAMDSARMAALGEMASGIAHEINNPLAIIQQWSNELRELVTEGNLEPKMLEKISVKIESTVARIAKIVSGLRTFARDGAEDPFELSAAKLIVEDTSTLCQEKMLKNGVELIIDPIDDDLKIECRPSQISQVLLNLLSNAVDAIGENAKLKNTAKWVRLTVKQDLQTVSFYITDCGHGISPEVAAKIFTPFFTTKPVGRGTGLGLSISSSIAKAHGGRLFVDTACANTRLVLQIKKFHRDVAPQPISDVA